MPQVIPMLIPGSRDTVNRYPECPHAGEIVLCTGPTRFTGILVEDHLCIYPRYPFPITCGERNQHGACPADYPFSDEYLKEVEKEKKSKDRYQKWKKQGGTRK